MNWDAIAAGAELLGSIAVIVTLLYLVRQLKSSEVAALNANMANMQAARLMVNNHRFDHLDLLLRANSGVEITELEHEQLLLLFDNESATMFFAFQNWRRLGSDGANQAATFARFLDQNACMLDIWNSELEKRRAENSIVEEWRTSVDDQLSQMQGDSHL